MIDSRGLMGAVLGIALSPPGWTQPQPQVRYGWTYVVNGQEALLQRGQPLPQNGQLFLRVQTGDRPVDVLLLNSNRGVTARTERPNYVKLEANQNQRIPWKPAPDPGKAYISFVEPDSPDSVWVQTTLRQWNKLPDPTQPALQLYQKIVLWKAEEKGAAVAGLEQHEIGAARAGSGRNVQVTRADAPPPDWAKSSRLLTWKSGQHPVVISRFASPSR
jgi:hypothetical protein